MAFWLERCAGCGACVEACPEDALGLVDGKALRDYDRCRVCGKCVQACAHRAQEIIGKEAETEEIVEQVMRDAPFFEDSGGGVTITGGEPTFQKEFLLELLAAFKQRGIHTAIETCGFFPRELIPELAETTDLFLYDLKHMDREKHVQATGGDNERIKENFRELLARAGSARLVPRIPLVPGFNTDDEAVRAFALFLEQAGYQGPVHLMPYHSWARGKYERLGRGKAFREAGTLSESRLEEIAGIFADKGFEPELYG